MNRLLRVRPSQKLMYENLPVQTKIINGRPRMKFYLKHRWGEGKASVGFDLDLIRTLVSGCLPVIMWFLFGEVFSPSGCLGWATLFYYGTP